MVILLLRMSEKIQRIVLCHKSTFMFTRKMYKYVTDRCFRLVTETAGLFQNPMSTTVPTCAVVTTTLTTCSPLLVGWRHWLEVQVVCVHLHVCTLDCTLPLPPPSDTHRHSLLLQYTFCMISTNTVHLFTCTTLYFLENLYCPSQLHTQLHNYNYAPTHTATTCNLCLARCI